MKRPTHRDPHAPQPLDADRFFAEIKPAFARLRRSGTGWAQQLEERRAWDATLMDGLDEK